MTDLAGLTPDALFGGKVTLAQPARGYRVNVDALLLAAFAAGKLSAPRPGPTSVKLAVDLGAGAGAVGLSLLHWGSAARVALVEIDEGAAAAARRNVESNGWGARGEVLRQSVDELDGGLGADLVVCNPPYFRPGQGRPAKHPQRRLGRHGDLACFARAARRVVGRRARACFIYPARDLAFLVDVLRTSGLEPKRLQCVHASRESPARVVLVEATPAKPGGLEVERPVFERVGGKANEELEGLFRG